MSRAFVSWPGWAVVVAPLLAAPLFAADPALPAKESPATAGERIRTMLKEKKISIEVVDQPLILAVNQLREQTKINFVLDRFTIQMIAQQMGQDMEGLPVNVKVKDKPIKDALDEIVVKPFHLAYAIIGDAVVISTEAMTTERQLKQHVACDFDEVEVVAALLQLKKETGFTNIVLDAAVEKGRAGKARVSLQMDDVPLETAVRLLAEMGGLRAIREANVLIVKPRPVAEEELQKPPKVGEADEYGHGEGHGSSSTAVHDKSRP
jgi:hypothetical protein